MSYFHIYCKERIPLHSLAHGYSVFPAPFIQEVILTLLCVLILLVKYDLSGIYESILLGSLFSSIVLDSGFIPVPYCFDYYSFVIYFETRTYEASDFVFSFSDCFNYLGSFEIPYEILGFFLIL